MADKGIKSCANCTHNNRSRCKFLDEATIAMSRLLNSKGEDVTWEHTILRTVVITDVGLKTFSCNNYKENKNGA